MARSIWSGSISFGLVNIPVKLVGAVSDKEIRFHMLHGKDGSRIKFKRVCAADGKEVPYEDIVKGYEVSRGQYVTFTDEELEAADPKAARTIDIQEFVPQQSIDPAYYEKPYYLMPDKQADKAYALLVAALEKSDRVGIARMVMREKEYLVALRAKAGVILLETMHFSEEVVPVSSIASELNAAPGEVDKKQLALAQQLIGSLEAEFEPERYRNEHREKVMQLIEQKAAGHEVVAPPEEKVVTKTVDILAALERSLAATKAGGRAKAKTSAGASSQATHTVHADKDDQALEGKGRGKRPAKKTAKRHPAAA